MAHAERTPGNRGEKVWVSRKKGSVDQLEHLREVAGARNHSQVVPEVLQYAAWTVDEVLAGGVIVSVKPDGTTAVYKGGIISAAEEAAKKRREQDAVQAVRFGTPITALGLPSYTFNRLIRSNITTVEALSEIPDRHLGFLGLGKISRNKIREALDALRRERELQQITTRRRNRKSA
ncbi:MAG: hypothetical protein A2868_02870 [Candidatus Levybacteria bacterium RIFCSPHIGHO2_01_FULL_40_15b]|nr:MAG: hypothetical protein A2868_02870 [Candidatus Levybacteria bacterium RIFCSPHIGHO2_01_FULL_40_15b]